MCSEARLHANLQDPRIVGLRDRAEVVGAAVADGSAEVRPVEETLPACIEPEEQNKDISKSATQDAQIPLESPKQVLLTYTDEAKKDKSE